MRYLTLLLALLALAGPVVAQADSYPFPVKIGEQTAETIEGVSTHAKVVKPVAAGDKMAVENVSGQIIVNIFPSDANGHVESSAQALILLFDASTSKGMGENMQGQALKPGFYLANVVGGGKTSRVVFQVK